MNDRTTAVVAQEGHQDSISGIRVERGPGWLFLALEQQAVARGDLAEGVCRLVRTSMAHRVVLELDELQVVNERIAAAIGLIGSRVREEGGVVRICGLKGENLSRLKAVSSAATVPHFDSRAEAVGWHDRHGGTS